MPGFTRSRTAAQAILNADLLEGVLWAREDQDRILTGLAYTGSTAEGDTAIDLFIGKSYQGTYFNSGLLTPQFNRDHVPLGALFIPGGRQLRGVVVDAAATLAVYLQLFIRDM